MANSDDLNKFPSQYRVFKKRSALRIQLDKPVKASQKYDVGCLYMQIAPAKNGNGVENGYAWVDEKISVKIGITDISQIIHAIKTGTEASLYHTYEGEVKTIKFSPKDGGGYFLNVEHTSGDNKNIISMPLDEAEVGTMMTMFSFALPLIHNWI